MVGDHLGVETNAGTQEPGFNSKHTEHLSAMTLQKRSAEESGAGTGRPKGGDEGEGKGEERGRG